MKARRITAGRGGLAALIVVLVMSAGGGALAYWSAPGGGAGSASAGTNLAVKLSPGTPVADLYPGSQTGVFLTVSNPNASPVRIDAIRLNTAQGAGGYAVDAGHSGCGLATLAFTTQTNGGAGWTVPGRVGQVNGTLSITLSGALAMGAAAANACQGASFSTYLRVGP